MKIAVLVDDSDQARVAFNKALEFTASVSNNVTLSVITTVEEETFQPLHDMLGDPKNYEREFVEHNLKASGGAQELLANYKDRAQEQNLQNVITHLLMGEDSKRVLVDFLNTHEFDYVFVGSRGITGMKKVFVTSFSDYVLKNTLTNVVVVRESFVF